MKIKNFKTKTLTLTLLTSLCVSAGFLNPASADEVTPETTDASTQEALDSTPTFDPSQVMTLEELQSKVDALQSEANKINESLLTATKNYETSITELETANIKAVDAEAKALKAEEEAEIAKDKMGTFARNSYINPISNEAALLNVATGDPGEAMKGAEYLEKIGESNSIILTDATTKKEIALKERISANKLKADADTKAKELQTELTLVQEEATKANEALNLKAEQLKIIQDKIAATGADASVAFNIEANAELCLTNILTPPPAAPQWGGFLNGMIPPEALCSVGDGQMLRWDAAVAYNLLKIEYEAHFGTPLGLTDTYRSYESQVTVFALKPGLAATPGNSNHGWGLAIDFDGLGGYDTPQYQWMLENAPRFGWYNPPWAQQNGSGANEPWHWNYGTFD